MATDRSRTAYRGLAILDPRYSGLRIDEAESTYTQAGPIPGVPVDQSSPRSRMVLRASGQQASGAQLRVQTQRAGFPGKQERGGGFIYQDETDANWYGWDVPNVITGWEWLSFIANGATLAQYVQPHCIRLQNGDVLLALRGDGSVAADRIQIRRFDVSGGTYTWSTVESIDPTGTLAVQAWPALVQLPDGRVQVYFWVTDGGTDTAQIRMYQSTDNGDTWSLASEAVLGTAVDTAEWNLRRIRVAYADSQMLLIAALDDAGGLPAGATTGEALLQYASDDEGASFRLIYTYDIANDENGAAPEVLPLNGGGFAVLYIDPITYYLNVRKLGSAFQSLGDVTSTTSELVDTAAQELAAWVGEDGVWYNAQIDDTGKNVVVFRSLNEGASWTGMSGAAGFVFEDDLWSSTTSSYPVDFTACETAGRTVMVSRVSTVATNDDYSIAAFYLGGHTNLTRSSRTAFREDTAQLGWGYTWLAVDEPDDVGWTLVSSGAPTVALTENGLNLSVPAAATNYYTKTYAGDVTSEIHVLIEGKLTDGGSVTTDRVGARIRIADGASEYQVTIRFGSTAYRVMDDVAAAQIGIDQTLTTSDKFQILVVLVAGKVRTWHRAAPLPGELERTWTGGVNGTVNNDGTPAASGLLSYGVLSTGSVTCDVDLRMWCHRSCEAGATLLQDGFDNPTDLFPRGYSAQPVRLPGLVRLEAVDGPTYYGESWDIDTAHTNGIELVDPRISPSPARRWKQTGTAAAEVVFNVSKVSATNTRIDTSTFCVGVFGCSTYDVLVDGYEDVGNTWVALADDAGYIADLSFRRVGDALIPDDTSTYVSTADTYIERNQLEGAVVRFAGPIYRRVLRNTEGYWSEATTKKPTIYLDPDYLDGTEPTGGVMRLGPGERGQVILVHGADEYSKIRVKIGTTDAGWGTQMQTGIVFLGSALIFGSEYGWGRVQETLANTALTTRRGGRRSSKALGPTRRAVEFGWEEGVDERDLHSGTEPDYVRGTSGGEPVAAANDIGPMLSGLLEELAGSHTPVIYLPRIPAGTPDEVRLRWPSQFVYGRIVSDIRRETILGDEGVGEVIRVASIRIEEEV